MVGKIGANTTARRNEFEARLRFGGGLNTRASADEVDPREAVAGENFVLDFRDTSFRRREQFDLAGTAPNGQEIRGYGQLIKIDGSITTLIQAGTVVYSTDFSTWTQVGTVLSGTRLRAPRHHIWELDEKLILTDLALVNPVLEWDGTTLSTMSHNLGGDFLARYCHIADERAIFANVKSGTATPHMLVGSQREDHTVLSVNDRPSSALSEADPWFLLTPDLKPINGIAGAFGLVALSSKRGQMWKLTGGSAKDFAIDGLYQDSAADGDEAVAFVGNDIVYGRQGRLESLVASERFGDVETSDISRDIADAIAGRGSWSIAYNSRLQRIYFHAGDDAELWVLFKPVVELGLSPWSKYTTRHPMGMNPSTMWSMRDPDTGLEHAFMGDASGNVFRLEGAGSGGDGGSVEIRAFRRSKLESGPGMAESFDVEGFVKYYRDEEVTLNLSMLWQGERVFNEAITLTLLGITGRPVYGGSNFYNDGTVYGSVFAGKLAREGFAPAGQSHDFQIELEVEDTSGFRIPEVQIAFRSAG